MLGCASGEKVIGGGVVFPGFASDDVTGGPNSPRVYATCARKGRT